MSKCNKLISVFHSGHFISYGMPCDPGTSTRMFTRSTRGVPLGNTCCSLWLLRCHLDSLVLRAQLNKPGKCALTVFLKDTTSFLPSPGITSGANNTLITCMML